jgi:hypothetical protein
MPTPVFDHGVEKIPDFGVPESTPSPIINQLLHEKFYIENGLQYYKYKVLNPQVLFSV